MQSTEQKIERAALAGLAAACMEERERSTEVSLAELAALVETAGGQPVVTLLQNKPTPDPRTFLGEGKVAELKELILANDCDLAVFDNELSPSQMRVLEEELGVRVLDRSGLILDIFAQRAQTREGQLQVELAQYKYMLPRLQRLWTHLERQGGGSGAGGGKGSVGLRGPGETQLEMDRRIILNRMALLKQRLAEIDTQKSTQRKNRGRLIRVALVGYTNVGKSTLMNLLAKSEVFAENKLFATLDTTVRKVIIENLPFLLSDTVGFIRKLPTDLVDSFKSTLDEVREADLLLHVVDISHPDFEEQIQVVDKTIADLGAGGKPTMIVFNKIDAYTYVEKAEDDLTPVPFLELISTARIPFCAKYSSHNLFCLASARSDLFKRINLDLFFPNSSISGLRLPSGILASTSSITRSISLISSCIILFALVICPGYH